MFAVRLVQCNAEQTSLSSPSSRIKSNWQTSQFHNFLSFYFVSSLLLLFISFSLFVPARQALNEYQYQMPAHTCNALISYSVFLLFLLFSTSVQYFTFFYLHHIALTFREQSTIANLRKVFRFFVSSLIII